MTGRETKITQENGIFTATDGKNTATGYSESEANEALLAQKASIDAQYAATLEPITLMNKVAVHQAMSANVEKLVIQPLKNPTKDGHKYVAFRNGNPGVQGLGTNETEAKLDLLNKEKVQVKPETSGGTELEGLTVEE